MNRKCVRPLWQFGAYIVWKDPEPFKSFYRMSIESFSLLQQRKQITKRRGRMELYNHCAARS